jgi:alpha-beta hydrolase superfamily lysophospholipase
LLTADLKAAVQAARRAHSGVPVTVLGHSMGGAVAIYTDQLAFLHILRKVLLRVSTKTDFLVLKLH